MNAHPRIAKLAAKPRSAYKRIKSEQPKMNALRIDYGDLAQEEISHKFTSFGATCNPPIKDRHGWDFLIEYPLKNEPSKPVDHSHPIRTIQAQVKSTTGRKPASKFKLSNGLKYASSDLPIFVFLVHYINGSDNPRIYGKHVWEAEIAEILKAARKMEVEQKQPSHKRILPIFFDEDDRVFGDYTAWVESKLSFIGENYAQKKSSLWKSVGYSEARAEISLTLSSAVLEDDIVAHELGLKESLPFEKLEVFDIRFQLKAPRPTVSEVGGTFTIQKTKPESATIKFSCGKDEKRVNVPARVFNSHVLGRKEKPTKTRITASCFDFIFDHDNELVHQTIDLSKTKTYSISDLLTFCKISKLSDGSAIKFRIETQHGQLRSTFSINKPEHRLFGSEAFDILTLLANDAEVGRNCSGQFSIEEFLLFLNHLGPLRQMIGAGSIRLNCELDDTPNEVIHFCGYYVAQLGENSVGMILQWDVKATNTDLDGRYNWYMSSLSVVETFVTSQGLESAQLDALAEFQSYISSKGAPLLRLGEGDLIVAIKSIVAGDTLAFHTSVD